MLCCTLENYLEHWSTACQPVCISLTLNPFLPTGQFLAPKLIVLIKCLIDILFFKVLF